MIESNMTDVIVNDELYFEENTTHIFYLQMSYEVSIVSILEIVGCITMSLHYTNLDSRPLSLGQLLSDPRLGLCLWGAV